MNAKIPKRIVQTGKKDNLTILEKASVANIKLINPGFEYLFFDNSDVEEFVINNFLEYRKYFLSFRFPIQKYDFFRYLAIYYYGGFYFDLDVLLAESIEGLLKYECVFPYEDITIYKFLREKYGMNWEVGNYAFGAIAGHPFVKDLIENCIRAQDDPEWIEPMQRSIPKIFRQEFYVLFTTGPGLVSRTFAEYENVNYPVKIIYPEKYYERENRHRFGKFGVHLMEGTWRKRKGVLERRLLDLWSWWVDRKINKERLRLRGSIIPKMLKRI